MRSTILINSFISLHLLIQLKMSRNGKRSDTTVPAIVKLFGSWCWRCNINSNIGVITRWWHGSAYWWVRWFSTVMTIYCPTNYLLTCTRWRTHWARSKIFIIIFISDKLGLSCVNATSSTCPLAIAITVDGSRWWGWGKLCIWVIDIATNRLRGWRWRKAAVIASVARNRRRWRLVSVNVNWSICCPT